MILPKRFKLHEAVGKGDTMPFDAVYLEGDKLIATDGVIAARVPIYEAGDTDVVRFEMGEDGDHVGLEPKAMAEAVRGTKGEGYLRVSAVVAEAQSADDKPRVLHAHARPRLPEEMAGAITTLLESAGGDITLSIDPEGLVRLARALGAQKGVRLTFSTDVHRPVLVEPVEGRGEVGTISQITCGP